MRERMKMNRECSPDKVVDDDIRGPEELDHVGHHIDLAPAPVRAGVQQHPEVDLYSGMSQELIPSFH